MFNSISIQRAALALLIFSTAFAQAQDKAHDLVKGPPPIHKEHHYSEYEKLILKNVSTFHRNFNNREFGKNGDLVVENLHVNSNGAELNGRDAFVQRIARFVGPFPDVKITDLITVVDGNTAAVRFVITGTQKGDLEMGGTVIKATNKSIHVDGSEFFTFDENGKLTDLVTVENMAQLITQLK
ncbi:ester cyclase [Acidicapsa dinghuensis]|uniref:Ester cyclase n=1 Tax=Acidicapsa dinghuensis TaxID=2218256 RepID=A0ABW1EHS4_9BACT|nr:ester cyclase [Acidicapsa dinghuensis]